MAALSTRVHVMFKTRYKFEFAVVFYVAPGIVDPSNAGVQEIITAIQNLTAAYGFRIELSAVEPHAVTATSAAKYINEDKFEAVFTGEGGVSHTYRLPSPLVSIVSSADNETIDCTAGFPQAFVDAVHLNAQGANGEVLTAPDLGHRRVNRKTLKK